MKRLFLFIALFATVWEMKAQSIGARLDGKLHWD